MRVTESQCFSSMLRLQSLRFSGAALSAASRLTGAGEGDEIRRKVVQLMGDIFGLKFSLPKCQSGKELKHLG